MEGPHIWFIMTSYLDVLLHPNCDDPCIYLGGSYRDMNDLVKPGTPPPNYEHVAPTQIAHACPTAAETQKDERRPIYKKQNSCPGEISAKRFT